jgi:VWFA-related protein
MGIGLICSGTSSKRHKEHIKMLRGTRLKPLLIVIVAIAVARPLLRSQNTQDAVPEIKIASQPYIPTDPNAIRVKSTMVDVTVVVRDAKGQPIAGLTQDDFQIFDEGKQQKIILFTSELAHPSIVKVDLPAATTEGPAIPPSAPVPPRYLGFYFDDKNMSTGQLVYLRKAAEKFVRENMEETDRAGIFTSSATVTQQFTSNKQQLLDALSKLLAHPHGQTFGSCPIITPYQAYQITQFYNTHSDALDLALAEAYGCRACDPHDPSGCARFVETKAATVLALEEDFAQDSLGVLGDVIRYMEKMPGRRTMIMASSGFFATSNQVQHAQDKMIDGAIHAGIIINTMDAKGLWAPFDMSEGEQLMRRETGREGAYASMLGTVENDVSDDPLASIAYGTGGKFFHNSNDLDGGLRDIAALPAASYVLGFSPDEAKDNGVYHNLKVKLPNHHDIHIEARPGYFEQTKQEALPSAKFQKLNKEVMSSDTLTEIQTEVTTNSGTLATGEPALKVTVHLPGKSLYFKKINKLHTERVMFITALFDMQNHYLAGTEAVMDMNLKDATFTKLSHDGVDAKSTLQAPSGTYRLRQVVQEVVGGRISTSTHEVQIR